MHKIQSPDVVVKNTAEAVMVPLKDGICSLNMFYKTLTDADVDTISGKCSNYNTIRQQIVSSERSLQRSEQEASSGLRRLDGSLERLTQDEGKLEWEKSSTELTLNNLITTQESNEKLLKESEGALENAEGSLRSARRTLKDQEDRKKKAKIVTGVGLAVTLIPIAGWVAGPAMAIGGAIEMDEASKAIEDAEDDVRSSKNQVEKYKSKVSDCESKISKTKGDISQKNNKLVNIRKDIQNMKSQKKNIGEFQRKVRDAVRTLSVLSGRTRVAKHQTRKFILQQPILKVMDEVVRATEQISGNQLLNNNGMLSLIGQMRENHQKLEAICAAEKSVEYASYY